MNKKLLFPLALSFVTLASCSINNETSEISNSTVENATSLDSNSYIDESSVNNSGSFSLLDESGNYISESDGVYSITNAGTYTAEGLLDDGYIYVNTTSEDDVIIELNGATIKSSSNSPIYAYQAEKLYVKAKKDTENLLKDTRSAKTTDSETQGEGVISADCDLTLNGSGTLVVSGTYNNGVHSTKDLTLKNQTLQVSAPYTAIKGKDSVTIEEGGTFTFVSSAGDGVKTENTDVSSSGNQRGTVTFTGGSINIDAYYDCIDAAYNFVMESGTDDDGNITTPTLIGTSGNYTTPTAKSGGWGDFDDRNSNNESHKGIKAANEINISSGYVDLTCEDDAIHANYGTSFDNGSSGVGSVNLNGGSFNLKSGDDGIHADNTLNVNGAYVNIECAVEGFESNFINMKSGNVYIYGVDDGLNCSKKINKTPNIVISGGYLDVTVAGGDTDGIDSNGTINITGGVTVARAQQLAGNENMGAIDSDSGTTISGGTLIVFGSSGTINTSGKVYSATFGSSTGGQTGPGGRAIGGNNSNTSSSISLSEGTVDVELNSQTVKDIELSSTKSGASKCNIFAIYTSDATSGNSYAIYNNGSKVTTWTA